MCGRDLEQRFLLRQTVNTAKVCTSRNISENVRGGRVNSTTQPLLVINLYT